MPTYEYLCPDGHKFERFNRKISDGVSELPCPVCGKIATRMLTGGAGLVFKGSGFYLTDYGKNAHRTSGPEGASSGAKGSDSGSSGGEGSGSGSSTSGGEKSSSGEGGGSKGSESKPSESKSSESKSSESKSSESKSSESKSSRESKSGDAKPASAPAPTKSNKSES
jgi:putative FmdB family regulatory protein